MVKKFSVKVGCQSLGFELKVLCAFVMDMVIPALSSLKVCIVMLSSVKYTEDFFFHHCVFFKSILRN